jgi:acyl-coenzyme A synthetase/AMP-(fatty) acid ligase
MEAVLLFWAAVQVGAVVVPLDPELPAEAAGELLPRVSPSLLLVDSARFGRLPPGSFRAVLVDENAPPPSGAVTLSNWFSDEDLERDRAAPDRRLACEPAAIVFTSGTTGRQKGVVLDHGALANSGRIMARSYEWSPRDVLLSTGDLHTMSGLRNPTVATACAGSAAVVPAAESRRGPLAVADCANRHRVTLLTTVPAALRGLLKAADRLQPGSLCALRAVLSTAARLPEELRASFEGRFRVPVLDYYGLTETAGFCAGRLPRSGSCAIASIGRPVDALFRLVDENGVDAAEGSSGELWIQSANLTSGYLDDPEATGAAFSGRWYRTGDLAVRNPDGSYSLVGRLREIIKNSHGEIVAPAEIEDALMSHPGVVDAGACAVSGGDGREKLLAFAVPQSGCGGDADAERLSVELRRYLLARLGPKRAPADVFVRKNLPRNSNGKLKAAELIAEVGSR